MSVRPLFQNQQAPSNEENTKAEVYLNIGYTNDKGEFVNLPFGLGIDNMREARVQGQNAEFNALRKQQNDLLAAVKQFISTIAPGEEKALKNLEIRARRRQEPAAAAPTPDVDLLKMLAGGEVPNPISFS